jgi:hypothetical protein
MSRTKVCAWVASVEHNQLVLNAVEACTERVEVSSFSPPPENRCGDLSAAILFFTVVFFAMPHAGLPPRTPVDSCLVWRDFAPAFPFNKKPGKEIEVSTNCRNFKINAAYL